MSQKLTRWADRLVEPKEDEDSISSEEPSFWADTPITASSQDALSRGPFAKLITEALLDSTQQSAVIGLSGPWGSGKSSVANLVLEHIGDRATKIVFEPWIIASRETLTQEFFVALGQAITANVNDVEKLKIRKQLWKYAGHLMGAVSVTASVGSAHYAWLKPVSNGAKQIKEAMHGGSEGLEALASSFSIRESKRRLSNTLAKLSSPVIVVIEDVDRLDREETKTVLQLIKICADFPNIRYLLLYDREQLEFALAGSVGNPSAFLEKIILQTFDLPEATVAQRIQFLDDSLSELKLHEGLSRSEMERLSMIFDQVLLPGLPTLRHIRRFVSTVRTLIPGVICDGFRNIDPADFLALEFLRLFLPSIYQLLRDEGAPIPGGRIAKAMSRDGFAEQRKTNRVEKIAQLDPFLQKLAQEALDSFEVRSGRISLQERRFATDYWKPVYFGFSEARATIPQRDWVAFLDQVKSENDLNIWFESWRDQGQRDRWINAICGRVNEFPLANAEHFLASLFNWGDKQTYEQSNMMGSSHFAWHEAVLNLAESILGVISSTRPLQPESFDGEPQHDNAAEALRIFRAAVDRSSTTVSPGRVLCLEVERRRDQKYSPEWIGNTNIDEIVSRLADQLSAEIEDNSIWQRPDPREAINVWHRLASRELTEAWDQAVSKNPQELARYANIYWGVCSRDPYHMDWGSSPDRVKAIRDIDLSLLTNDGLWARDHILRSNRNISE